MDELKQKYLEAQKKMRKTATKPQKFKALKDEDEEDDSFEEEKLVA